MNPLLLFFLPDTLLSPFVHVLVCVYVLKDGGGGGDGGGLGRRNLNEKHQDKKGKAICKYYIEGRCTWVSGTNVHYFALSLYVDRVSHSF